MSDKYFVDTNILVYAYNADERAKHARASALIKELWDQKTGVLSLQVLIEGIKFINPFRQVKGRTS